MAEKRTIRRFSVFVPVLAVFVLLLWLFSGAILSRVGQFLILDEKPEVSDAVVVPYEDYLKKWAETGENEGLLLAKGALSDIEDFEQFIENIYEAREKSIDRIVKEI